MEFFGNCRPAQIRDKFKVTKALLKDSNVEYVSVIDSPLLYYQSILSIGDFNSGKILAHLYKKSLLKESDWKNAFRELNLDDSRYFTNKDLSQVLPWEHIVFTDHNKNINRTKHILENLDRADENENCI
jgi:hypothetical protein